MTKTYYECHITLNGDPEIIQWAVENMKWKFSKIDGDPVEGAGVKCYATKHYNAKHASNAVVAILMHSATVLGAYPTIEVTRRKVELVIFDDRSSKVRCDGLCPECTK